jgi:hypothetical protein
MCFVEEKSMDLRVKQRLAVFGQRALSRPNTVLNSYELAADCIKRGILGDFVECGVFAGTQSAAMALANYINAGGRRVHLFDSFQGLPNPGPRDDTTITSLTDQYNCPKDGKLISTGIDVCTVAQVKQHMKEWGIDPINLYYYEGWFQNTVPAAAEAGAIDKIAVLRLDGDYYESTKVCLEHFHPLVQKGGFVIVDDYALTGCKTAMMEYWGQNNIKPTVIPIPDGGGPVYYQV